MDKNKAEIVARRFFEAIDNRNWLSFETTLANSINVEMRSPER